ncbi:MAG: tetratricopeptide repeat protein [Nitrospirota bacterium]
MTADELFDKGLDNLKSGNRLGALACFEKAYSLEKIPKIQSYLAFCMATERGQITDAIRLCEDAIAREPDNPLHYLNLGKVYIKAERKSDALIIFRKGLSLGEDLELKTLLENIGTRNKPIFPFLPRGNFFNKYLGLLLSRLRLR